MFRIYRILKSLAKCPLKDYIFKNASMRNELIISAINFRFFEQFDEPISIYDMKLIKFRHANFVARTYFIF